VSWNGNVLAAVAALLDDIEIAAGLEGHFLYQCLVSSIRSSVARQRGPKRPSTQCFMSQFPTHPNREFFWGLAAELNRAIREIFSLIRESALVHFFGICFDDKCDRPRRPRLCREGEEGAARCSKPPKPDLALEAGFVHVKARQAFPKIGRQVRRREQTTFRASRWRRWSCRALPDAPAPSKLRDRVRGVGPRGPSRAP
jgi:hypothetical protein